MATILSKSEWAEILKNESLTNDTVLAILHAFYSCNDQKAYSSQVGLMLGYNSKKPQGPVNFEVSRYAKRISAVYDVEFTKRSNGKTKYWDFFFNGWQEGKFFAWQLKPEIVEALKESGLTGETLYPEEILPDEVGLLSEGAMRTIAVNAYERSPKARQLCLNTWGTLCCVCGFDFHSVYGDIGKGFIHVHHLIPLHQIGESYQVDPVRDLRPVCPNCHSMLHRKNPPYEIDEMKKIVQASTAVKLSDE